MRHGCLRYFRIRRRGDRQILPVSGEGRLGRAHSGFLTGDDLAGWTPMSRVTLDRQGWTLAKAGPWSQGPALLQALTMLDDVAPAGPDRVHASVEAVKLAMADREAWYGDVDDVPVDDLLRPRTPPRGGRSSGTRPAKPCGRVPRVGACLGLPRHPGRRRPPPPRHGEPTVGRTGTTRDDTCHVDVVDRWGNLVSPRRPAGWLQSLGHPRPGLPARHAGADVLAGAGPAQPAGPRQAPAHDPSPSLALRGGVPPWPSARRAVISRSSGSCASGSPTSWTGWTSRRPSTRRPGTRPAFRRPSTRDMTPGEVVVESRIGDDAVAALRARGHDVTVSGPGPSGPCRR